MVSNIVLYCPQDKDAQRWAQALRTALPEATITVWPERNSHADYAVVWSPSQDFIDAHQQVRAIFNLGAGVDALLKLRIPASVPLVRIENGGMAAQMADYVCHAVLGHFRQFDTYSTSMRARQWKPLAPRLRSNYPVGVMGLGVLGQHVAQHLLGFEFPVRGWSRSAKQMAGVQCYHGTDQFHAFLAATRILVCMLPLTPETRGILNCNTLSRLMPPGYLINVARGAHLVDADLLDLIDSGQMAGATLDVFHTEPLPPDDPLRSRAQITLTPHISAQTLMHEATAQISSKIRALHAGGTITGVVDPMQAY